ncbi:MAG: prolipoprotein diacylglyceryl transferase, partial [Oscillospiraceae bacterium]|nr:prolipoprotein diacylglyceryl transferase [Oscillospiraceae bacterium]
RWGNFTNQEAFGCNTTSLFGMSSGRIQNWIAAHGDTATLKAGEVMEVTKPVHPCFLYESVWCILGFVLLAVFAKKFRRFDGQIILTYAAWYGLGRFFIEGLRTDSLMIGSLRASQALAALCVVVSVTLLIVIGFKVKRMGTDYVLYCDTEESKQLIRESEEKYSKTDNECEDDETKAEEKTSEKEENSEDPEDTEENQNG